MPERDDILDDILLEVEAQATTPLPLGVARTSATHVTARGPPTDTRPQSNEPSGSAVGTRVN